MFGQDSDWKAQFTGAVKWSTLGVVADSVTDNTAALNALPANTPIIGDAPAGGFIYAATSWLWKSGLTVWQQPGCLIKSGVTTLGNYAIDDPNFANSIPNTNIQYYGLNLSFVTPTDQVRVIRLWADHFKLKYYTIDGCGGFIYVRGSDQEIAYGLVKNALTGVGNDGIRHIGNMPKVQTSAGMRANVWVHHNNINVGDAPFQVAQPLGTALWTNVSTDDVLFEDNYGSSASSALILINQPNPSQTPNSPDHFSNYTCSNVTFRNTNGTGLWAALISAGGDLGQTSAILIDGGSMTALVSNAPPVFAGNFNAVGPPQTGRASNITVKNTRLVSPFATPYEADGVTGFSFAGNGNTFNGGAV